MHKFGAVIVLALMAPACGPDKGGGSSETGASTASSESSTGGPGGSETGASPTTGALSCEDYVTEKDELGAPVEITLRNPGSEPVWIGAVGCGGMPLVAILDAEQEDHNHYGSDCWPVLCQDFLGLDDCQEGCNNCGAAVARRLGPGATLTMNWPGTRAETALMTAECAPGMNCQRDCLVARKAAAGDYSVEVKAFHACTGACACDGPTDSCALWDVVELGQPVDVAVPLMYPDVTQVEVVLAGP